MYVYVYVCVLTRVSRNSGNHTALVCVMTGGGASTRPAHARLQSEFDEAIAVRAPGRPGPRGHD